MWQIHGMLFIKPLFEEQQVCYIKFKNTRMAEFRSLGNRSNKINLKLNK